MRTFEKNRMRNLGIMAHIDAGKTTTTERILYYTGMIHKMGEVHDGTSTTDHMIQEKERGITITSASITTEWKYNDNDYMFNLIDTPGHVDFGAEVERSLRVLDGAVAVFCAVGGVEPQSETVWRQADKYNVPRIAFINKMDRSGADYFSVVNQIREKLGTTPIALHIPIGSMDTFKGFVDIIEGKAIVWKNEDMGAKYEFEEIPLEFVAQYKSMYEEMLETLSDKDDSILEKFLEDASSITKEDIKASIRNLVIKREVVPVFCGSAFKNKGVQTILDAVCAYLPSPIDREQIIGKDPDSDEEIIVNPSDDNFMSSLAFKIATDKYVGRLTYIRVYSGRLVSGTTVLNTRTGRKERINRLYKMQANVQNPVDSVDAGDIVGVVGMKDVRTGDTLCDPNHPIVLESMTFTKPVIGMRIEAKSQADMDKLGIALSKLSEEDPTFHVSTSEYGETVIMGMGELHLEIILDRLNREFGVECKSGDLQVSYQEAFTKTVKHREVFSKQTGGRGKFADIIFEIGPTEEGVEGLVFVNDVKGGHIPKEYIPSVEKGFKEAMLNGPLAGYPINGMKITLLDGSFHAVDSDSLSFELCAKEAFRNVGMSCKPAILEPVMNIEILTPEDYIGSVIGDINKRRGRVDSLEAKGNAKSIKTKVPLSETIGYVTGLRTITSGRATFNMEFFRYEKTTQDIQEKVLKSEKTTK